MQISRIAIFRPVTTLMASLAMIFLGIMSYRELQVQRLPDLIFPSLAYAARVNQADLSPEETNDQITRPLEKLVAALPGIKNTYSTTSDGTVWGYAQFEINTNMRYRVIELQDKISKWLAGREDVEVEVFPQTTEQMLQGLMTAILSVPEGGEVYVSDTTDRIQRKIKSIDGISEVRVDGDLIPNFVLETERDALLSLSIEVEKLIDTINKRAGEPRWLGYIHEAGHQHAAQFDPRVYTMNEVMALGVDQHGAFRMRDLAREQPRVENSESVFRINGKKAVRITISKERDRNAIGMAHEVRARLDDLRKDLPAGFELTVMEDEAKELEEMIENLAELATTGAFLSMLVLLVFVRSWRIAFVVALSIPASIIITFNALYASGLTINILSLMGLTVGVGMLVDNSIVVVENVFRHTKHAPNVLEATWRGSREVTRALLVSTATNLVVFVPLLFLDDEFVLIVRQMALALAFPMAVSLLIAMTLVPMLTARVIGISRRSHFTYPAWLTRLFHRLNPYHRPNGPKRRVLMEFVFFWSKASLRHPIRLFFSIAIVLLVSLFAAGIKIAVQQMSKSLETRNVTVYGKTPAGSDLEATDALFHEEEQKIREALKDSDVFENFTSRFDKSGGEIELRVAEKYRRVPDWEFIDAFTPKFQAGDEHSGFRMRPFPRASSVPLTPTVRRMMDDKTGTESVMITGENIEAMTIAAEKVRLWLEKTPDVNTVALDTPPGDAEVHFTPDIELMLVMQADLQGLGSFFNARDPHGTPTRLILNHNGIDRRVLVKLYDPREEQLRREGRTHQTLFDLRRTKISTAGGGVAPLEMLGSFSIAHAAPEIQKENRQRNLTLSFNFKPAMYKAGMEVAHQTRLREMQRGLSEMHLPTGISATLRGTLEQIDKQSMTWKKLLAMAVLATYLVLAFFFESVSTPIIVLATIPLATVGAIWGIIAFGAQLDEIAMLGTIILVGLVVNNGILLIEYTQQMERERGWRRQRALLAAVSYRVRPIIMTSMTTILGLLPILLSKDAGTEARSLVAVLVGGLVIATILTLVVIPTFYNVSAIGMEQFGLLLWRFIGLIPNRFRKSGGSDPELHRALRSSALPDSPEQLRIRVDNVSKLYPRFHKRRLLHWIPPRDYAYGRRPPRGNRALYQVSLDIEPGMFGLLGPNGAGKSTLMKILTGIIPQTYGVIAIGGVDLRQNRLGVRKWISFLPQNFGVYGQLTLEQYLEFFAPFYGLNDKTERRRRIGEAIEWVGLSGVHTKPMARFLGGMRQRAGIAQLLLRPCPIIIVDEPTAGLDPVERVRFRLLLAELARTRIVILSTHIVDDITSSCRRVAVLNRGEVVYEGDTDHIRDSARGMIWDLVLPEAEPNPLSARSVLYKKHLGDSILYHYCGAQPLEGSKPVEANFEDAYVALLWRHDTRVKEDAEAED